MGFLESLIPVIPDNRNEDLKNKTKETLYPGDRDRNMKTPNNFSGYPEITHSISK